MRATFDSGEEREFHFGQALLGHQFKKLEISLAEMQRLAKTNSWEYIMSYMKHSVFCRMLPGCSITLTIGGR